MKHNYYTLYQEIRENQKYPYVEQEQAAAKEFRREFDAQWRKAGKPVFNYEHSKNGQGFILSFQDNEPLTKAVNLCFAHAYTRYDMAHSLCDVVFPFESLHEESSFAVDPAGKHTLEEVEFERRIQKLHKAMDLCPEANQQHLGRLLTQMHTKGTNLNSFHEKMKKHSYILGRTQGAAMMCADEEVSSVMVSTCNQMANGEPFRRMDKLLTAMECVAGINQKPISADTKQLLTILGVPLTISLSDDYTRLPSRFPEKMEFPFFDFENMLRNQWSIHPRNWGRMPDEMPDDLKDSPALHNLMEQYAKNQVKDRLDLLYDNVDRDPAHPDIDRNSLIIIDGLTLEERIGEEYRKAFPDEHKRAERLDKASPWYQQNAADLSNKIVAAALMAGKRVEAFVPNEHGNLPEKPVELTKTGYEPNPIKPVILNAWERFFSHLGFYKEKKAQAKLYQETMEARERVQNSYALRSGKLLSDRDHKAMFFGTAYKQAGSISSMLEKMDKITHNLTTKQEDRSSYVSGCILMMLSEGHKLDDILDPAKLKQERLDTGTRFIELADEAGKLAKENKPAPLHGIFVAGQKKLLGEIDRITRQYNLQDPKQYASYNQKYGNILVNLATDSIQDIPKVYKASNSGFKKIADLTLEEQTLNSKVTATGFALKCISEGYHSMTTLATPSATNKNLDFARIATMGVVTSMLRNNSTAPFSEIFSDHHIVGHAPLIESQIPGSAGNKINQQSSRWQDSYKVVMSGLIQKSVKFDQGELHLADDIMKKLLNPTPVAQAPAATAKSK